MHSAYEEEPEVASDFDRTAAQKDAVASGDEITTEDREATVYDKSKVHADPDAVEDFSLLKSDGTDDPETLSEDTEVTLPKGTEVDLGDAVMRQPEEPDTYEEGAAGDPNYDVGETNPKG